MPAPPHLTFASHLWVSLIRRAQPIWATFAQKLHQRPMARSLPHKSRLALYWHNRKRVAAPASQQMGTPYNPLYDLPALPPFRSIEGSLGTGTRTVRLSDQASAALDATLPRLQQVLEASQWRQLTAERLVEVCLLISAADLQTHGADSQIVKLLGHQVIDQLGRQERGKHSV
jgi:hypothetical protein